MGDKGIGLMALNDAKAGMKGLDKDKINKIIEEASKGSKYYEAQLEKQKRIDERIQGLKERLSDIKNPASVDNILLELEERRDLSRTIVHVDMDAYYASVEMLGPPQIPKDLPIAVGSTGMLCTSNYAARKYGVRAGMPGFIGKKLCPQLKIIPPDFSKYTAIAQEIRKVLAQYDANFSPMSLDEAYLDITDYLKTVVIGPEKVVEKLRQDIFDATGLTASAGIAPNTYLAKVASDQNKPNGQFYLRPERDTIMSFVRDLPVRKVGGIGNVTSQLLNAIGIHTCSELLDKLSVVKVLFSDISFDNFAHISLGLGANTLSSADRERKSMSTETTFRDTCDEGELLRICKELASDLSSELSISGLKGKCITLKIKTDKFQVKSKAMSIKNYTNDPVIIANNAELCLKWFFRNIETKPLRLRLMGARMSEFGSLEKSQSTLETFLRSPPVKVKVSCPNCAKETPSDEINAHLDECLSLENNLEAVQASVHSSEESKKEDPASFTCPVCVKVFNEESHIDDCLSRQTIKEILSNNKRSSPGTSGHCHSQKKKLKTIDSYFQP